MAGNPAQAPITTIPPFGDINALPGCATACGALYNANGACVPPGGPSAAASVYTACFCSNAEVAPFSTGTAGVCDGACGAQGSVGMSSIATWFQSLCNVKGHAGATTKKATTDDTTTATTGGSSSGNSSGSSSDNNGGDWFSNHWKWVIVLIVLVLLIAGVWVGACIWRRRYLKRKDRQSSLGQKQSGSVSHPSWGPGVAAAAAPGVYGSDAPADQAVFAGGPPPSEKPAHKMAWAGRSQR